MRIVDNIFKRRSQLLPLSVTDFKTGTATAGTTQTQAGATALTKLVTFVTTGNANDGVALPTGKLAGEFVIVSNVSANALKVYPYNASGGAINNGSANAAYVQAASVGGAYLSLGDNNWVSF